MLPLLALAVLTQSGPCYPAAAAPQRAAPIAGQPADVRVVTTRVEAATHRWVERVRGDGPVCVGLVFAGAGARGDTPRWFAFRATPAVPGGWVRVEARTADGGYATRTDALRAVWAPTAPRLVRTDSAAILSTP